MTKLEQALLADKPKLTETLISGNKCPGDFVEGLPSCANDSTCALAIAEGIDKCVECWSNSWEANHE